MLDLSLASECAFCGPTSFEPFPSFLLKNSEMRSKRGYLDNIVEAKKKGVSGNIKKTDDANKNLERIFELYKFIDNLHDLKKKIENDVELKDHFRSIGATEKDTIDTYKFMQYLMCTN